VVPDKPLRVFDVCNLFDNCQRPVLEFGSLGGGQAGGASYHAWAPISDTEVIARVFRLRYTRA
jgi:hypothetical protein